MSRRIKGAPCTALVPFTTLAFVVGCGGGGASSTSGISAGTPSSSATDPPADPPADPPGDPPSYTIGGTISGLPSGVGMTLADDGVLNSTSWSNGAFTLAAIASGSTYNVTEGGFSGLTESIGCTFSDASGVVGDANVTNVSIACDSNAQLSVTISGLLGTGLVLQDSTGDSFPVAAADTSLSLSTAIASGATYDITVSAQPVDPTQICRVTDGSGTAGATIAVSVSCVTPDDWTWVSGSQTVNVSGTYGTIGTPSPSNAPGARWGAVSWRDASGNLWLFGGYGYAGDDAGDLNDLWEFTPATGEWTWVSGPQTLDSSGSYGTLGAAAPSNIPGARDSAVSWIDASGNLWLFGGEGYDSEGDYGDLDDLWEFSPATEQWTWVSGAELDNQAGSYGTEETPSADNVPGAREGAVSWIDTAGNLWLFGGSETTSSGYGGDLNDLWEFSPTTRQWTWVSGSDTFDNDGSYGILGKAAPSNVPGARDTGVSWIDASGNLWLFGGEGYDSEGNDGDLDDLWEYSPATRQWTWMSGADTAGATGVYGTLGTASTSNVPGAREGDVSWTDASGNLWLFGGYGYDSTGYAGSLNDLWEYSPATGQWAWMSGADTAGATGVYGTQGTASTSNVPGARAGAVSWIDASGTLWLFGGDYVPGTDEVSSDLNDLWNFVPPGS